MSRILTISQIQFLIRQNVQSYRTSLDGNVPIEIIDNQSAFENAKIRKILKQDDVCVGVTSVHGKIKEPIRLFENWVFRNFRNFQPFFNRFLNQKPHVFRNRKKGNACNSGNSYNSKPHKKPENNDSNKLTYESSSGGKYQEFQKMLAHSMNIDIKRSTINVYM